MFVQKETLHSDELPKETTCLQEIAILMKANALASELAKAVAAHERFAKSETATNIDTLRESLPEPYRDIFYKALWSVEEGIKPLLSVVQQVGFMGSGGARKRGNFETTESCEGCDTNFNPKDSDPRRPYLLIDRKCYASNILVGTMLATFNLTSEVKWELSEEGIAIGSHRDGLGIAAIRPVMSKEEYLFYLTEEGWEACASKMKSFEESRDELALFLYDRYCSNGKTWNSIDKLVTELMTVERQMGIGISPTAADVSDPRVRSPGGIVLFWPSARPL